MLESLEVERTAPKITLNNVTRSIEGLNLTNRFSKDVYPNCHAGHEYAVKVITGEIVSCIYVKGACIRYMRDINHSFFKNFQFEPDRAEHFMVEVQKFKHVIGVGTWPTDLILWNPWQKFIWMNIMGFINKDTGFRRFRVAHLEVPRGQAKSTMASQASLYFLGLDPKSPRGNQIATAATKKDQARIVLDAARAMGMGCDDYSSRANVKIRAHDIVGLDAISKMRALSAEAQTLDGLNDVLAVTDELHSMKRDVYEVISSGMSKRKDSLLLSITTAGKDLSSVGYTESNYSKRLCLGEEEDDQRFSIIYTIDEDDDWTEEISWRKANPEYGMAVDPVTFAAKVKKAISTPADEANVKIKHLNIWVNEASAYYDKKIWDVGADLSLVIEAFSKRDVIMSVDKAQHLDLNSLVYLFERDNKFYMFDKTYCPEATIDKKDNDNYLKWVRDGYLIKTSGEVMNQKLIEDEILKDSKIYNIIQLGYDPYNAVELGQNLERANINAVAFGMNVRNLSEPTKKLDEYMRNKKIFHNGSPLMSWCISNVVCKVDHNENVYPRKNNVKQKIDPVIALLMCIGIRLQYGKPLEQQKFNGFKRI